MIQRRVRKLRLRAPEEALLHRGAILVEDALHTASLPMAAGGRQWLVRSLHLGRIRPRQSPATLALKIEELMRHLPGVAVDADEEAAARASAVYFRDEVQPLTALAIRLCRGEAPPAWFWPLAVPGWVPTMPKAEALRLVLSRVMETAPGPVAAAMLVDTLVRRNLTTPLVGALGWQDGPALLRAMGWQPPSIPAAAPQADMAAFVPPHWIPVLRQAVAQWGIQDARSLWIAGMAMIARRPASLTDAALPRRAAALVRSLAARAERQEQTAGDGIPERPEIAPVEALTGRLPAVSSETIPQPAQAAFAPEATAEPVPSPAERIESEPPPPSREPDGSLSTGFAGLFFLVPILERLGFPQALAQNPAWIEDQLACAILRRIAVRLEAREDEPMLLALPPADPYHPDVLPWIRQIRRWCRLEARIGPYNVVRRRGRLLYTPTHIDVFFDLTDADIRIRREGLDIDPGWVPWFGRVIHFHYGDGDRLP